VMRLCALAALGTALFAGAALASGRAGAEDACTARPVIERFFAGLAAGDAAGVDQLFARDGEGWAWYAIADPAGQRLGSESRSRSTLGAYLAARINQHERITLVTIDENGGGNFTIRVQRRADDLRGGEAVQRVGKGWVSCSTGKINVFLLGGAPTPSTFGPCPRGVLPLTQDLRPAGNAVLRFVHRTYSEMSPALDIRGARVVWAKRARGLAEGYTARVKCGNVIQRRTAVVLVRLPQIGTREPNAWLRFYVSRLPTGWLVWRLV
jgi:hypothetical protein